MMTFLTAKLRKAIATEVATYLGVAIGGAASVAGYSFLIEPLCTAAGVN